MIDPSDLNKDFLRRNQTALEAEGVNVGNHLPMDLTQPLKADIAAENGLQAHCESYLTRQGGLRMTATMVQDVHDGKRLQPPFWFGHLYNTKRNPLFPDLIIVDGRNEKPVLFVELKVANKWQPGQREMVELGVWKLAWNYEEFVELVKQWRKS